ncbi:transposase [Penicillium diatomitis]|uniref:Transposase n=1 Tax=Penicillium diatomitis TaxID=2819901 RepID=A0A9W9X4N8_9EURO|nr:transposase [Penicillium diatomitis]KAJ5483813.1 transposase [Penicillium diatomitis]
MPKSSDFDDSRLAEACKVVLSQKKPNITAIAREFRVDRKTLTRRVEKAKSLITPTKSLRKVLVPYQEEALISWIVRMYGWNLPPTPVVVAVWANRALARSGQPDRQVGKNWPYYFMKRLPTHLGLGPMKQKTKELKQIQAEDAGLLQHWYDLLENVLHNVPARLVYNFDECGFQPGQGRPRNVIGAKSSCPDLAETERGENITALECITADGWQMDPLETLSPDTLTAISPNGWISDELALAWLGYFIQSTAHRVNRDKKRVLIFDGHGAHLTLEFLQTYEDNAIIPFAFLPHTIHLCQPLDGKPFLNYKQQFRMMNNKLAFWGGQPYGKSDFLSIIGPIRKEAFSQRVIRDSFRERGIYPVKGSKIVADLTNQLEIPDLYAPDLRWASRTPSPRPNLSSSSVENSPPKSIEALSKNQAKITKHLDKLDSNLGKLKRNICRVLEHQKEMAEELDMTQDSIQRIRECQQPTRRQYTKRQVKPLSQTGILTTRDANRSIEARKKEDSAKQERKIVKLYKKVHGCEPPQRSEESIQRAIANAEAARLAGEPFFVDN